MTLNLHCERDIILEADGRYTFSATYRAQLVANIVAGYAASPKLNTSMSVCSLVSWAEKVVDKILENTAQRLEVRYG